MPSPQAKLRIARAVFERQGDADLATEEYRSFEASAAEWLKPYAVFIWLRGVMGTGEHWRWGALAQPTPEVRGGWGEGSEAMNVAAAVLLGARLPACAGSCLVLSPSLPLQPARPLQTIERLAAPDREWHRSLQFTYWLQFHLHRQLATASAYAASKHVALKGDLPIGERES